MRLRPELASSRFRRCPCDAGVGNGTMMAKTSGARKAGRMLHFSRVRRECLVGRFFLPSAPARLLAEIPEQPRHEAERLFGHREQDVLIGRMLRAAGIGMRNPDRRYAE